MDQRIKTSVFILAGLVWPAFFALNGGGTTIRQNPLLPQKDGRPAELNAEDKAQLTEFFRLKNLYGSRVWPDFDKAEIPLILYNDREEFLIHHPGPSTPWTKIEKDAFQTEPYYFRPAENPQAFAARVGDLWAGSLDTLSHMNQTMEKMLREKLPPEKLTPALFKSMKITPAQHVVTLLHETFHAFQAGSNPVRFEKANLSYSSEKQYPFKDEKIKSAWNQEGSLLNAALREKDESQRRVVIGKFLESRARRRAGESWTPELISFEDELEWLEGLAKYAEMRFAELGAEDSAANSKEGYAVVKIRLTSDFAWRTTRLGELGQDLRFYLSGAAQAMLLDQISPEWKKEYLAQKAESLTECLRAAMEAKK